MANEVVEEDRKVREQIHQTIGAVTRALDRKEKVTQEEEKIHTDRRKEEKVSQSDSEEEEEENMKIGREKKEEQREVHVAIAQLMRLTNQLYSLVPRLRHSNALPSSSSLSESTKQSPSLKLLTEGVRTLLLLCAPLAPHLSAELWEKIVSVDRNDEYSSPW